MNRRILALALGLAVAAPAFVVAQQAYRPGPHNITFPANFEREFIRYATVDKTDARKITRFLYVNREAFAAVKAGEPLPYGTIIVMADKKARLDAAGNPLLDQQGRFITEGDYVAVGMQQKERGWGEGYGPEKRNGEWEYAAFTGTGDRRDVSLDGCFSCHIQARSAQDFAFNLWDFAQTKN